MWGNADQMMLLFEILRFRIGGEILYVKARCEDADYRYVLARIYSRKLMLALTWVSNEIFSDFVPCITRQFNFRSKETSAD